MGSTDLPQAGSPLALSVSFVELVPSTPLVRLWGLWGGRREQYERLREDIQNGPGPRLASVPPGHGGEALSAGDQCLAELGGRWLRGRVVESGRLPRSSGREYRVLLIDEGRTVTIGPYYLARGRPELFELPAQALGCILADLVPPGNFWEEAASEPRGSSSHLLSFGWSSSAVEFLGHLHGREVSGLVREVLTPQRLVVLELPRLAAQMHHLGLASQISPAVFRTLLSSTLGGGHSLPPEQAQPPLPPPAAALPPPPP